VLFVLGTRPEAIKLAPIARRALESADRFETRVCLTGQHTHHVRPALDYFDVPAHDDLAAMRPGQSSCELMSRIANGLESLVRTYKPQAIVAAGDTTSVLATSLVAFLTKTPLVHVEAGLRTHSLAAPWPEEYNRRVASLSAALHCAPTEQAAGQLRGEGIAHDAILVTGNPVVDALRWAWRRENSRTQNRGKLSIWTQRPFVLVTAHRHESIPTGLQRICHAIRLAAAEWPHVRFLLPVHPNPNVGGIIRSELGSTAGVELCDPFDYGDFIWLLGRAAAVVTDSGGVQEEAISLGRPVIVARGETDRPEGNATAGVIVAGTSVSGITAGLRKALGRQVPLATDEMIARSPFGDGASADRILSAMATLIDSKIVGPAAKTVPLPHLMAWRWTTKPVFDSKTR
jgi:UDP-N-acetylglucosamine 2-epimerase (non-hydrolysing)